MWEKKIQKKNHNKNQWRVQWVLVAKLHQTLHFLLIVWMYMNKVNGNPITYICEK